MHILNVLGVAENSDTAWLHNVNEEVVLKDAAVIFPHKIPQLEPNLLLEVDSLVHHQVYTPVIRNSVTLIPST